MNTTPPQDADDDDSTIDYGSDATHDYGEAELFMAFYGEEAVLGRCSTASVDCLTDVMFSAPPDPQSITDEVFTAMPE